MVVERGPLFDVTVVLIWASSACEFVEGSVTVVVAVALSVEVEL